MIAVTEGYLAAVSKGLKYMESAGLKRYGVRLEADEIAAYAMVLADRHCSQDAVEMACRWLASREREFPAASELAEKAKELAERKANDERNKALLANYQSDAPALEASTESGSVERWREVVEKLNEGSVHKTMPDLHEPDEAEIAANKAILDEQVARLRESV